MRTACTQRRLLAALLAQLLAAQVGLPRAAAQTATSGAEDAGVLREAKAAADRSACTCTAWWCQTDDPLCPASPPGGKALGGRWGGRPFLERALSQQQQPL